MDMFVSIDSLAEEIVEVQLNNNVSLEDVHDDSYYYNDSYKKFLDEYSEDINSTLEDTDSYEDEEENIVLTNDIVINRIVDALEIYQEMYRIPEEKLDNNDWDILFDNLFKWYCDKELLEYYYEDMMRLNKIAVSCSLVYEQDVLDINTYIDTIPFLESDIMDMDEAITIKNDINNKINCNKVIDFSKCLKLKRESTS